MAIIDKINFGLSNIGKTGADLEKAIGVSHSVYSQWNTGKTKPSKRRLPDIAAFLGVSVEWLLSEETEIPATGNGNGVIGADSDKDEAIKLYQDAPQWLKDQVLALLKAEVSSRADSGKDPKVP